MTHFTEDQAADIAEQYRQGEGLKDLSAAMHTSDRQIKQVLTAAGVPIRVRRAKDVDAEIVRLHRLGRSQHAIAKELHVHTRRVAEEVKGSGLPLRPQHSPKFTAAIEREIVRRHAARESTKALSQEYGCCTVTIQAIVRRNGGAIGPRGNRYREFSADEVAEMRRLWESGKSQHAIAQGLGVSQSIVSRVLRQHGVESEERLQRGEDHGRWKGGIININGYRYARVGADHPLAVMRGRMPYVAEHRLVMAEAIGRPLTSHEYVHHINGDKADNRLENLQLMSASHTKGQAMCCADCGSRNLIPCPIPEESLP